MTFGELKEIFANLYEQTNAPTTGASIRNRFINLAAKTITRRYKWSWRQNSNSGVADGTNSFSLADDFDAEGIVTDTFRVGGEVWAEIVNDEIEVYSDSSQVFVLQGNDRDGYEAHFPCAIPVSGTAITYRYYRKHPELVDDGDITIIPDGECICNLAIGRFFKSEGEGDEAVTFLQDAENGYEDMRTEERRRKPVRRIKKTRMRDYNDVTTLY